MAKPLNEATAVADAIREIANKLGHVPSRSEFRAQAGVSEYQILRHFPSWREAVRAAGFEPNSTNARLEDDTLLEDWGALVRKNRRIPTRVQYRKEGTYSPEVFEKHFGPWSAIPERFRAFAQIKPDWTDVVALLPVPATPETRRMLPSAPTAGGDFAISTPTSGHRHNKLEGVPTYGDPIDFRGLRHEPVNEQGVVFLFGMVAKELGFLVEAMRVGFPDCEAKRRIAPERWQRVYIEFEFESRNFWNHGHPASGCDVIVCWKHNWEDCPEELEVVELSSVIRSLGNAEDQTEPVGSSQGQKHPTAHDSLPGVTP